MSEQARIAAVLSEAEERELCAMDAKGSCPDRYGPTLRYWCNNCLIDDLAALLRTTLERAERAEQALREG